jgi:hypothetical protein
MGFKHPDNFFICFINNGGRSMEFITGMPESIKYIGHYHNSCNNWFRMGHNVNKHGVRHDNIPRRVGQEFMQNEPN